MVLKKILEILGVILEKKFTNFKLKFLFDSQVVFWINFDQGEGLLNSYFAWLLMKKYCVKLINIYQPFIENSLDVNVDDVQKNMMLNGAIWSYPIRFL